MICLFYLLTLSRLCLFEFMERDKAFEKRDSELRNPQDVYFMKGVVAQSLRWQEVRERFLTDSNQQGFTIRFEDVNAWARSQLRLSKVDPDESGGASILPGIPNFYFEESGRVHFSLPRDG